MLQSVMLQSVMLQSVMKRRLGYFVALGLLLAMIGMCIPCYEGEGGGGAEGCFTACRGVVPYTNSFAIYLSGATPSWIHLPVSTTGFQRYHSGFPCWALVMDISLQKWYVHIDPFRLTVNLVSPIFLIGSVACIFFSIFWVFHVIRLEKSKNGTDSN